MFYLYRFLGCLEYYTMVQGVATRTPQGRVVKGSKMVVHVRYKSLYISLPSSVQQQRQMTKFCVYWSRNAKDGDCFFRIFIWNRNLALHI